jgi:hypothetical protein
MILPKGKEGVSNGCFKNNPSLTENVYHKGKIRWQMHVLMKLQNLSHIWI